MPPLLFLFTLANLVIGTGAFVLGGILAPIAESLDVTVPAAGQAMTAYAMATALLAPVLLIATGRWPRKHAMVLALTLFTLGNALCAIASDLPTLIAGRVLMGMGGMFTPVAAGIAIALVEPARRGKALATVFLGISLSYAIGVPLGAWLGFRHGWQTPVLAVAAASALMLALVAWRVPRDIDAPGARFSGLGPVLTHPPVLWTLALTLSYFIAIFCVFSYIGPVLQSLEPMPPSQLSLTLAMFGCSGAAGTLIGGWANDRFGAHRSLRVQLSVLGTMMVLLPLTQGHYAAIVAVLVIWGTAGFGMMTPQQARLAMLAPAQAPLLLSLNTSMLYFGTALGAVVGGVAVAHVGFAHLPWAGVPFALAGLLTLVVKAPRTTLRPSA
jgi:DHA1 family inner membrane transport protein